MANEPMIQNLVRLRGELVALLETCAGLPPDAAALTPMLTR